MNETDLKVLAFMRLYWGILDISMCDTVSIEYNVLLIVCENKCEISY